MEETERWLGIPRNFGINANVTAVLQLYIVASRIPA